MCLLTVGFYSNRFRELSCYGLVARSHSERHEPGVKSQTYENKHVKLLLISFNNNQRTNVSSQSSSHLWACAPTLESLPPPSRGSPPGCAADPRGLCADVPVCSGLSWCRALGGSKPRWWCCHTPGTPRPGSQELRELQRGDSVSVTRKMQKSSSSTDDAFVSDQMSAWFIRCRWVLLISIINILNLQSY